MSSDDNEDPLISTPIIDTHKYLNKKNTEIFNCQAFMNYLQTTYQKTSAAAKAIASDIITLCHILQHRLITMFC